MLPLTDENPFNWLAFTRRFFYGHSIWVTLEPSEAELMCHSCASRHPGFFPRKRESSRSSHKRNPQRTRTSTSFGIPAFAGITDKAPHSRCLRYRRPLPPGERRVGSFGYYVTDLKGTASPAVVMCGGDIVNRCQPVRTRFLRGFPVRRLRPEARRPHLQMIGRPGLLPGRIGRPEAGYIRSERQDVLGILAPIG